MQTSLLHDAMLRAFPNLSPSQVQVLHALLFSPNHSSSAAQLRILLGLAAVVQVNAAMGQVGRKVFKILGHHPEGLSEGTFEWWHIIATGLHTEYGGFVWSLRPDVCRALQACGLSDIGPRMADDVDADAELSEGAVRKVLVNAYERNPIARARCIAFYGLHCVVCGLSFGERYGKVAEGFIHVHHLRQLSDIGREYAVDPIQDLRPVCPNCHAVMHMTDPPYTIEQVQAFLASHNGV